MLYYLATTPFLLRRCSPLGIDPGRGQHREYIVLRWYLHDFRKKCVCHRQVVDRLVVCFDISVLYICLIRRSSCRVNCQDHRCDWVVVLSLSWVYLPGIE